MSRSRSSYDAAARQVLQEGPFELFRLCGIPLPVKLLPMEFGDARKLRVDYLSLARDGQAVHIEFQARNERNIEDRMLEYRCPMIKRFTRRAPLQFVLYGGKAPLTMQGSLREPGLSYDFSVIDIRALNPEPLMNSKHLADNLVSVLCAGAELKPVSREILRRGIRQRRAIEPMLDLLLVLFKLKGFRFADALEVLDMPEVFDLTQFPKLKKSVELVREKGREEGLEQGRQAELVESRRRLLVMMESRFGHVPQIVVRLVRKAGSKELDEYSLRLLSAQKPVDVVR